MIIVAYKNDDKVRFINKNSLDFENSVDHEFKNNLFIKIDLIKNSKILICNLFGKIKEIELDTQSTTLERNWLD
jgi:hypothetical protein